MTQRNDKLLNSYNPLQLSAWRANVDMQFIISRRRVLNYCAKYATKPEPRSKALKSIYSNVMKSLKDDGNPLKVVQKLMISSVGERDFSAQETCHLLLQLPMYRASRDFVVLSLDGSRQLDDNLNEAENVTVDSLLDHYCARPATSHFEGMTLLEFAQSYRTPKNASGEGPVCRKKKVIVITRPCCSPDPLGPNYEQYCRQKLMLYRSFRRLDELLGSADTHSAAYTVFLLSGAVPPSNDSRLQGEKHAETMMRRALRTSMRLHR